MHRTALRRAAVAVTAVMGADWSDLLQMEASFIGTSLPNGPRHSGHNSKYSRSVISQSPVQGCSPDSIGSKLWVSVSCLVCSGFA